MTELVSTMADKIDRTMQRVIPLAYRVRRTGRRLVRRALRKPRSVSEGPNLLPLLIQVLASFSKADGVLLEEEIDSSLGFLRYDYPEAVYSELRQLFRQALYEQQDLTAMAQKLSLQLSTERKIMAVVPLTMAASQMLPFVIIGGLFFHITGLITLGIYCYAILLVFQLITLPVEFDASRRAKIILQQMGIVQPGAEVAGVNSVLNAAALTYVAAFIAALGNLLWLLAVRDRRS